MRASVCCVLLVACSDYELNPQDPVGSDPIEELVLAEPVAVTGPSVRMKRGEETVLDSSMSFDPDDEEPVFEYVWWVENEPQGAVYTLSEVESAAALFSAESLGVFEVGLLVIDEDGLESTNPALTSIEILPYEQMELRLTWDIPDVDLDLHLVRPNGSYYSETDDCYFGNPLPDWGVLGDRRDDPFLETDSEDGNSPETIRLQVPEEGVYEVFVHYFDSRDATQIYATPSLEIRAEGQGLSLDVGPKLYGPGKVWKAGVLDWSTLTWTPSTVLTTHSDLGGPPVNQ